jgi:hypothetical protein
MRASLQARFEDEINKKSFDFYIKQAEIEAS